MDTNEITRKSTADIVISNIAQMADPKGLNPLKIFLVFFADGSIEQYDTEAQALLRQRQWRKAVGRDEVTGEVLSLDKKEPNLHSDGDEIFISVVITNFNYGRFLSQAIDSVLSQTYSNIECIVVDDGSTDNSREVIASRPTVKAIFKQNDGQSQALRTGVEAARGNVIISLDGDDWLLEEACAKIAAAWHPKVSCLNFRLSLNGDLSRFWPVEPFLQDGHQAFLAKNGYYPSAPMSGNAFSALYAKEFLSRADHLDSNGVDAHLLYSAPFFGKVAHIEEVLGVYRMHGDNVSMASGKKTVNNLGDHVHYQYWAQQNAQRFAQERGIAFPLQRCLVGAYPSLWLLLASDCGYDRKSLPDQGRLITIYMAIKGFINSPGFSCGQRLKNICLLGLMAILPAHQRRKLANSLFF